MSDVRRVLVALAGAEDPALVPELAGVLGPGFPDAGHAAPPRRGLRATYAGPDGFPDSAGGPGRSPPDVAIHQRMADAEDEGVDRASGRVA
jgi:hypothetical protein